MIRGINGGKILVSKISIFPSNAKNGSVNEKTKLLFISPPIIFFLHYLGHISLGIDYGMNFS